MAALKVRRNTIQIGDIERDAVAGKSHGRPLGDFTASGGDFQQRQAPETRDGNNPLQQFARGCNPSEPAVDAGEIAQGGLRFGGRTVLGIKNLLGVRALHKIWRFPSENQSRSTASLWCQKSVGLGEKSHRW